MSSQPQRRGRPVVAPYSSPAVRSASASSSAASVGNGPAPTRVTYALSDAMTLVDPPARCPAPAQAPPAVGEDEVTNG